VTEIGFSDVRNLESVRIFAREERVRKTANEYNLEISEQLFMFVLF